MPEPHKPPTQHIAPICSGAYYPPGATRGVRVDVLELRPAEALIVGNTMPPRWVPRNHILRDIGFGRP
jgi:hypothetical protein